MSELVPIHPIAPHLKDGPKKPRVAPSIDARTIDSPRRLRRVLDQGMLLHVTTDDGSPVIACLKGRSRDVTLG